MTKAINQKYRSAQPITNLDQSTDLDTDNLNSPDQVFTLENSNESENRISSQNLDWANTSRYENVIATDSYDSQVLQQASDHHHNYTQGIDKRYNYKYHRSVDHYPATPQQVLQTQTSHVSIPKHKLKNTRHFVTRSVDHPTSLTSNILINQLASQNLNQTHHESANLMNKLKNNNNQTNKLKHSIKSACNSIKSRRESYHKQSRKHSSYRSKKNSESSIKIAQSRNSLCVEPIFRSIVNSNNSNIGNMCNEIDTCNNSHNVDEKSKFLHPNSEKLVTNFSVGETDICTTCIGQGVLQASLQPTATLIQNQDLVHNFNHINKQPIIISSNLKTDQTNYSSNIVFANNNQNNKNTNILHSKNLRLPSKQPNLRRRETIVFEKLNPCLTNHWGFKLWQLLILLFVCVPILCLSFKVYQNTDRKNVKSSSKSDPTLQTIIDDNEYDLNLKLSSKIKRLNFSQQVGKYSKIYVMFRFETKR